MKEPCGNTTPSLPWATLSPTARCSPQSGPCTGRSVCSSQVERAEKSLGFAVVDQTFVEFLKGRRWFACSSPSGSEWERSRQASGAPVCPCLCDRTRLFAVAGGHVSTASLCVPRKLQQHSHGGHLSRLRGPGHLHGSPSCVPDSVRHVCGACAVGQPLSELPELRNQQVKPLFCLSAQTLMAG